MKKTILTLVAAFSFLCSSAQDFVYYPKEIKAKSEESNYTDKYMVNGEGQITQLLSVIEYNGEGSSLISYEFCIIPKYDNKLGIVKGAKVYEYYNYRDNTLDPNEYIAWDYTFDYVTDTKIKVQVKRSENAVKIKDGDEDGEININEKGELVSSNIGLVHTHQPVYDDKGNFVSDNTGSYLYEFKYNDLKGALTHITTPKWLIPVLSRFNHNQTSRTFNWGNTVNAVTGFKEIEPEREESEKERSAIQFTYEYNEDGYPASFSIEGSRDSDKEAGEIKYNKKKVKK